jgi:hypothetical protein
VQSITACGEGTCSPFMGGHDRRHAGTRGGCFFFWDNGVPNLGNVVAGGDLPLEMPIQFGCPTALARPVMRS